MYDALAVRRALLAHAQSAHDGTLALDVAAARIRALAAEAATWADPIEAKLIELADGFDLGDFCTVVVPSLQGVVARDGALPVWKQSEGELIVYLEADGRAQAAKDEAEERERFPGFPKPRP